MGNKCCKCQSSTYSSANATIRSFSSYNSSIVRSDRSHALTFGGTSTHGDSLTTLTMKSSNHSDVGKDYHGGSLSTVGQEDPIPVFLRRLNDLNARVGTRTRLLIELDDASGVQVRWYHNNQEAENERYQYIHEGGFYCLDIVPVTLEDEGLWVCSAQNYAGKSSTAAHLSLIVPKAFKKPIFIEPLRAVLTQRGIVSLECKVIGVPTPKLRWYKDDKEIKAGDIFALTANSEDCLGIYTCEATNVMGTAVSTSKIQVTHMQPDTKSHADSLIPYGPSPKFVKGLKNVTEKVGNALILECQVEIPPWPRSVGWYNDAGIVNEGPLYHLIADGMGMYGVEIKSLRADHSTTWKCVVTSLTGVKAVTSCLVTVSYPKNYRVPRFLESLRAIMTDEGLVSFECKVIGYPTPQLSWFKDGKQLQPGDVYELTGSKSLGSYCCVARNCMGETSSLAELTMEDIQNQLNESEKLQLTSNTQPPRFLLGLKSAEANINESFVFMIKVTTESTPLIKWYKEDEELTESNRYQFSTEDNGIFVLNILPLEINDQAEWKCVAVNKYGQTVTSSFLKLNIPKHFKPPKFLEELRIAFSNEGSVNLECKVIGVPQPQLKWFKDGQELNPGDMHKIISGQSGTCCLGTYTCQAHNCMGTVTSSATLLTMEDKSTVKSCASEEYLSVGNQLVRNESLSTIPEERTSQMEKSYTIEEPADVSFSFDGKEVTVSLYETPDLTHDEALQIIEMYADELSEHISEDNVVDLPSLRIVKESSISGPVMMEALVIDVPIDFCQQQPVSDTQFDGVSLTEDTTLANIDKSDSLCENSLEYFSDHFSSSNSKRDIFFSVSETTPKNASVIQKQQSEKEAHQSVQTPKLFMSDSDDQILTQLNLEEKNVHQTSRNPIGPLARSESNNTEEEVSETLADIENEQPLPHNYCAAEILTQSDEDGLYSAMLNKIRNKGVSSTELSSEEDDVLKIISRPNVDEFLKYMKIILEGTMVKMHTHESFNYTDSPTELERSIQALHSLAWKFIEETEKDDMTELDKNTTENVSSLMTAINASLLALEQIDDPFGVSDNVLNEIQSSVCFDFETFNNKDLSAIDILKCLSDQIRNFTTVVNRQVAQVTEQRIMAVLRNTIGTTLVYIKTLQQNSSKIKCINVNSLVSLFSMVQPLETILNDIAFIEEASVEDGKCNHKLKQMLIPPISSIAFSLDNLNMALKNENSVDDQDLKDIYSKINDATNQFMILASQGTETNNLAECFISFTKPINDLCCHLRRLGRSTENIISSDYGSDDKLLMDFETLFDELMMDIDTLINNVNIVRDSENNMNPLGSLLEPLQDMKIGLFQVNQVLLSNQTSSNMSYEVISCFEHLSHQLVQLNSCIINQSIIEETDKEIPFESSIKMMQNILFDDAIDDLGVNGILFGSVLKPLLHLQNLIVSKMASVESDLSFSEHTDATGGAQSLSLSMSNNAQTVFNKPEKDKLVSEIVELSGLDNMTKEYDDNNAQIQASSSKIINDFMLLENNEKSDLVPKPDFKFDIEERFKDEEPSIIMTEDDRENSGFEVLFDETDLETFSDFIEDERSNKIVFSENKPLEVLMDKSGIDSINEENDYNVIPQHVLTSFEKGIELDSILNSSDDLFDEIQETLKNITEATLDETIEMNSSDENSQETHNLQENSSYCSEELISQIDKLTNNSLDENEGNCNVLIKQDRLQSVKDITENCQNDGIILELEQDDTFVNKYTDVCNNDTLKINQIHQVSEIIQDLDSIEEIELVDSDKTISNNTIITNNEISDSLEMKTVKSNNVNNMKTTVDDAFTSSTVINNENTSKREDFLDQVQDGFIKINNDQLEIENTIENSGTVIKKLDFNNEISKGLLKTLDTIEFIESKNDISETIHSQDIKSSEKQKNKFSDFLETNKVSDNVFNQSKENIVNISHEIEDCDSSMRDVTDKIAVLEPHVNTTLIENFKELIVLENGQQKLDNDIIEEINTAINSETENKIIIEGRKSLFLANNNNQIELNTISIVNIDCKNENTTEDSLMIRNVDTTIVEESPNEIKQCVSNLNDNDKNDTFDADTFTETFDQSEECISSLNHELIIISKNKSIIDECNILKENVILRENKFDEPFDKDELLEDAGLDGTSEGDFQESVNLSSTTGEKMSVPESSELSLIMCSDKENTNLETDINSNEDDVLCSSNKIENESIMKDKLKNIEQISFIEEKSFVNIINGTEENKIEESNKKCKILSNVSEIDKNVDLKLSNIEDAIQVVNLEVPKEELNVNNELLKNISNVLMVNKLINTENNETEIRKIPSESYISNIDNGIKEVLITESKHDSLNKFEFSSDLSMNQEEIFSNEMNKENYILESTTESKNSGVFINVFDKSIEGLEQASVSENNNAINDRVCEFQNKGIELIKEPLLLTIENIASINNEIIASESIQLIDQQQFEGNEIEVKYEDNRKDAIREKEIILGYIEDNKNNSEQLETKDRNGEEQIISKNNNLKKEVIKFRTDSLNVPIAQNMVLECEEDNSTEFVRPIKEVIDNNFKIIDKKSEQFIENLIHAEKDNEQEEKNEPNNESLTENNSAELNQNYDTKEINRNVTNEKIEIQTLKSNDEKVILATNIKDKNVTRTDHVEKKLTTKPKLYYESGIEACMTENQLVNSQTDLESTNISTEKDKCVDIIHSYDSNDFPLEENIEYNSINQRDLISNQNNIQFNNTETIAVDFTQATKESKVCNSYLDENNVNQYPQVTESQTVNVLENASSITKTQLNEKSTQINTINETESKTIEENDENRVKIKFNKDDDKSINDQSSVSISIDECKGTLNENILDIDETKSLSPCNTTMENVSEIFTEKLVDVIEITEMNVLESLNDNDKNIEKIKENELNTENIKKEVTESKNLENISMINDTSLDATKNPEETNVNKPTNIETNVFESTKIEYLLDNANTSINFPLNQNSPNEYCISKKGNDTDEKYILNQSTNENNELEHTANLIKLKSDNESNCTILNDQGKQEIGVIVINNDDKQCITDEFNEMTLNKNEINILHNKGINKRVNVSDLEIKVDLLCESLTEDEIIDLVVDRDLNDLAIKPKLHYIEQNAANQTECIALENANILKQNERSSIENITEHAKVEHELNTAVIGDMVMNYDSVKENSSNSLFDLCSLLETAIIDTIDEHSNKIVMKNIDILKAPNANLTINNNDSVTEKESSGFIDDSMVINEENNRNILTSNCVKNENEKDDELNKENKQIKKEVIQKCPVKLESDEDIFKEPQNNDVSIFDTQQSLNKDNINVENLSISTDIICPLNDNNTQAKENEPTLNVTNDTQDIKITNKETTKETDNKKNIKQSLSLQSNKSPPDIIENFNESKEKNQFVCEIEEATKKLSNDKKHEFEIKSQDIEETNKNISLENVKKVSGGIEKVNSNESNENQIENQKSSQVDSNQIKPMNDEKFTDKKRQGSKKKKASTQTLDKKLLTPNKLLENSESKSKTDEEMKTIDSKTEDSNRYLLENHEKVIKIESNLELNSLEKSNTIISIASNNKYDKNVVEETEKNVENDERTENHKDNVFDEDKMQLVKNEVDIDKTIQENKHTRLQHQDEQLSSLDELLENNKEEKEKLKIIESTTEENSKQHTKDKEKMKEIDSKLEEVLVLKNNENTLKELQNINNDTNKNILNNEQKEKNKFEINKKILMKKESDTNKDSNKEKRDIKKKKKSPLSPTENLASSDELMAITNRDEKIEQVIEVKPNTDFDGKNNENISSNKLSDMAEKETNETNKTDVSIMPNEIILDNVKQTIQILKEVIPENNTTDIFKINDENKNEPKKMDMDKNAIENSSTNQDNINEKIKYEILSEKSLSLENLVRTANVETDKKWKSIDTKENDSVEDERKREMKCVQRVDSCLDVTKLENSNRDKNKRKNSESKKSKGEQVKCFEENKMKRENKEVVQPIRVIPRKSSVEETTAEIRVTKEDSNESYDKNLANQIGRIKSFDTAEKQTVLNDGERHGEKCFAEITAKDEKVASGKWTNHINTVTKIFDAPVARRRNFETRSPTPCHGYEDRGVSNITKITASARSEELLSRGKDASPRYLTVTDAYRSRQTPLTYRSFTPETSYRSLTPELSRFSELTKTYAGTTGIGGKKERYRGDRSFSSYAEPVRPANKFYERNLSPVNAMYRSPSEMTLRTHHRLDDDDISWYSRSRRRVSDSFLHRSDSWDNYSNRKWSVTKDDLDRTKETFKRLYFCVRLMDQTVSSGTRVKFWCSIIGYPEPRVQWYRDGQKLNSFTYNSSARYQTKFTNGLAQLIIDNAQSGDSGEYTCVAVNSGDRISTTAFLTVYTSPTLFGVAPKRSLQPASLSADGFKSTSLDRLYQWSGDDLRRNFRITSDWRSCNDVLRYPKYPKIVTTVITDDITTYGGTIALQVRVQGSPFPTVSWMWQSRPLPRLSTKYVYLDEGELHTLLVKDSTARDGGTYVCRACNLYGTANVEKTVKVVSPQDYSEHRGVKPAVIVSRPNDRLNVAVGEDITVTLRVAGEPKPKVVWMRGWRDVTFLNRSLKETVNDYVKLSIKKAQLSDAGTYFIIAKNVYGSDRAFVTVGVRKRARSLTPPRIRNTIGRWNAIGGGVCNAKNDVPGSVASEPVVSDRANNRISLRWDKPEKAETILVYKVEAQSTDEECWRQVGLTPTNSIDVYNLKSGNRYKFRVTARNRFGWGQSVVTSDYVDVWELKHLPEFFQPLPGETKVLLGNSAKLQCHVRGVPVPQVTWFKDGEPLVTAKYVTECTERGRCTLTIVDATNEDAGRYACEAVNVCGRVNTLTVVEVMANRRMVEAEQKLQGCLMKNNDFKESAPVFTKRLNDRCVEINSTVRLSCQVHGLPVPLVLWYKDNHPVDFTGNEKSYRDSDNFSTLELTNVKYDDSGAYTAVATNSIGTASTRCVLEVINKKCMDPAVPEFTFGLPSTYETADSIILKAQIDAFRPVKVEWFRDGIQLRNGRRVDIITNHDGNLELRIACATKRDSGTYMLRVSNDTGTIESRCDVDVVELKHFNIGLEQISLENNLYSKKPKFVVKPKFQEVEEGQEVIIDSEIVGDPLPKITWLRDGLKPEYYRDNSEFTCVSDGHRHQLKIPHAKLTHTGTYALLAANPHGQIKALISLQVYSTGHCKKKMENGINRTTVERLPRISRGLFDVECHENDCVAFECKLNITQETDVRWQKDGKLVRLGKDIKSELIGGDTARLEISSVSPLHKGLYTCTAFNELGQDSTSARLILLDSAQDVTTKLTASSNGQRKTIPSSLKLAGESNDRSSKRLKRSSAPKFYAVLHDKIADVGETVRFQCSVSGHPPPWSSWEKDGRPIGINSRMKIREDDDHRSLEICDITADDAGLYRITVENKFGKILATARLEVMTHHQTNDVQITSSTNGRRQSGSTACAGENYTLSCDIRGNSMSDVTWYKDDNEVKPDDRVTLNRDDLASRLSISNLESADTGVYTCIARCESGVTRCSTELCVFDTKLAKDSYLQPPIFVEGLVPMCTVGEGERVELTVKLQGAVPMSATWFKDDVPVPDCEDFAYTVGENGTFTLSIVDPFSADSGNYSCKVVNTFGEAVSHGQLVIKEIESDHLVKSVVLQNSDVVLTELNNNSKVSGKDARDIIPQNKESTAETVTGLLPATILWGPCDTTVLRGAKVVLETSYAGKPEPRIQWLRAGKVLAETDERLRITNADGISSLTIDSITADDCGKYIVRVDNGLGNDYHFASVAVEGPPDPPAGRPSVSVSETSADVTWPSPAYDGGCMVTGYSVEVRPFNQTDWKLVADKCHSLSHIVRGLAPGESYVFRVRAENMHGSSEASLESIPVYILQTDYGNTLVPKKVNIENGELFTKQYEVLDELGKGRYGVVRKVKERESGKYYAAKFVRCIKSKDKEKAQEEVDIMNCLRHPKLLQLDAAYENPREVVMVTEYISGGELFERVVADDFTLTEKDCILFTRQICEGVDYMHKQNVVHLDLKPENIMCQSRTSHQIKLIDFGLAQKIVPGKPIRVLFGTPEFIPPEIISYEPIGVESDMWSVGVICYVLLSGLSPFMGDNDPETFNNITKAEFDFDDESFDAISQDSKDFISALLIKKKEKRLTARECLKHKWLAQQDMDMSCVILSTDKLKKFIIRRKWQKTGNAIRALGRMATLSAASRRCGGSGGGATVSGGGGVSQRLKMASLSEEELAGDSSSSPPSSSPSPPHDESRTADVPKTNVVAETDESVAASRGGRRSCDMRSDSGFSECSSLASSSSSSSSSSAATATGGYHHVRPSAKKPSAIAEETCHQPPQLSVVTSGPTTAVATAMRPTPRSPAHIPLSSLGAVGGVRQKNRLIFDNTSRKGGTVSVATGGAGIGGIAGRVPAGSATAAATDTAAGAGVRRKEPIRIQTGDNFKKAVAFWKQ